MRRIVLIAITVVLTVFALAACEKSEEQFVNLIEGTYVGIITNSEGLKGQGAGETIGDASAEITKIRKGTIEVHLYNVELDTTFMLNVYEHQDSVQVCFTGDDFENMYGHKMGQGHISGGMMNDIQNDETEWMHHLNDEHENNDEHFGVFNMLNHTFGYRFISIEGGISTYLKFEGKKE